MLGNNTKTILRKGGHLASIQSMNGSPFKDYFIFSIRSTIEIEGEVSLLTKVLNPLYLICNIPIVTIKGQWPLRSYSTLLKLMVVLAF